MKKKFMLGIATSAIFAMSAYSAENVTKIKITDKVLVKNTKNFGINFGNDTPWSPNLKARNRMNFEGTAYRRAVVVGPESTNDTITTFMLDKHWLEIINKGGATYTVLSGPEKGKSGKIISATISKKYDRWNNGRPENMYAITIKPAFTTPLKRQAGVMIESIRLEDGQIASSEVHYKKQNKLIISHDVSPDSWGKCSLKLLPGSDFNLRVGKLPVGVPKLKVDVSFLAKSLNGNMPVNFKSNSGNLSKSIEISNKWKKYSFDLELSDLNSNKEFWLNISGSDEFLIDDISTDMTGDTNPTAFRDVHFNILKDLNPGILRCLQMGGSNVENFLNPKLKRYTYTHKGTETGPYTMHTKQSVDVHDYYTLCEEIGAEVWLNIPGTIKEIDIKQIMEYLGAPANVGFGKLRAKQGHPKPWTEKLTGIHIEFGNEVFNFAPPFYANGYDGPDYWEKLIKIGKESPYYKDNIVFQAGVHQFVNHKGITKDVPNADEYDYAPYVLYTLSKKNLEQLGSDENLLKWALSYPIMNQRGDGRRGLFSTYAKTKKRKTDAKISIYETNYHIVFGDTELKDIHKITTTLAGGVGIINAMLMNLKTFSIVNQCFFNYGVEGKNNKGKYDANWSSLIESENGIPRYKPSLLAFKLVNSVMGGNLHETIQEETPTFDGFNGKKFIITDKSKNLPLIWSYAFKQGKKPRLFLLI